MPQVTVIVVDASAWFAAHWAQQEHPKVATLPVLRAYAIDRDLVRFGVGMFDRRVPRGWKLRWCEWGADPSLLYVGVLPRD